MSARERRRFLAFVVLYRRRRLLTSQWRHLSIGRLFRRRHLWSSKRRLWTLSGGVSLFGRRWSLLLFWRRRLWFSKRRLWPLSGGVLWSVGGEVYCFLGDGVSGSLSDGYGLSAAAFLWSVDGWVCCFLGDGVSGSLNDSCGEICWQRSLLTSRRRRLSVFGLF